jgi:DNA replication protein DnaC
LAHTLRELGRGGFVDRAENVLAFGLPGVGKSHAASAIGHALIDSGRSVLHQPTFRLVQELLVAKRDLQLPRALRKLDLFDVILIDDIGYVQQNSEEVEVLFTLMAERYERRSMIITSNLVFSQWDQIFKNPMTTAAAIDRVVHHAVILEFNVPSYRSEEAQGRNHSASQDDKSSAHDEEQGTAT